MANPLRDMAEANAAFLTLGLGISVGTAPVILAEAGIDEAHPQRLRLLHRFIATHPDALTTQTINPSPVFVLLAQALHRHGYTGVPLIGCAACGARERRLGRRDEHSRPVCAACYRPPSRLCGRCGRIRPVGLRGRDGQPDLCSGCHQGQVRTCSMCGQSRVSYVAPDGRARCQRCIPRPLRTCVECGRSRKVQADWPIGPVCTTCYARVRANPIVCPSCHTRRPLIAESPPGRRVCAACVGASDDCACRICGTAGNLYTDRTCAACVLVARLAVHFPIEAPRRAQLQPLLDATTSAPRPRNVISWLATSPVSSLLGELARSTDPITHEQLDALPISMTVHNARSLLVETGVLPARVEYLDRITPWLGSTLVRVPDEHARHVRQFANWWLLRRARARPRTKPYTAAAGAGVRQRVQVAVAFLAWLHERHLSLQHVTQAHLDQWLADGPAARRTLRPFIQWAREWHIISDVDVPPATVAMASHLQGEEQHWEHLRRCLHDAAMPLHVRTAGALLLLFGLSATRIANIRIREIEQNGQKTHLILARHRLLVPPLLARLLLKQRDHAATRWAVTTTQNADRPLFPGLHGRPIDAEALRAKLRRHGIRPLAGRNTALAVFAGDLPPVVLADLLGIGINTATRWAGCARRDWTPFIAERRTQPNRSS